MKKLVLLFLLFVPYFLHAQEWLELYKKSQDNYENNNLDSALQQAERSLLLYEHEYGKQNTNYCSILRQIVLICFANGDLDKGIENAKKESEILKSLGDAADKVTLAGALNNLALLYQAKGEAQMAEPVFREVITIDENLEGADEELAIAKGQLAISQFALQEIDEARENFEQSIAYFKSTENLPYDYLTILLNYGIFLATKEDFQNALINLEDAKELYDQFGENTGPEYIMLLKNLGRTNEKLNDRDAATELLQQALGLAKQVYGDTDPETISIKNELALIYQKLGMSEMADSLMSQVNIEETDKEGQLEYAISQSNQGALKQSQGDFQKAEEFYLEAISIFEKYNEEVNSYLNTLQNLGRLYQAQAKFEKASNQFQKARERALANYGENSQAYAEILVDIAGLYRISNNKSESRALYEKALAIFSSDPESSHREEARAHEGIALYFMEMRDWDQSQTHFLEAMNLYNTGGDTDMSKLLVVKGNYAVLKQAMGEYKSAESLMKEVYNETKNLKGDGSIDAALSAENLGSVLLEEAKYSEAEDIFNTALAIREKYGKDRPEYAVGLMNIARLRVRQGRYTEAEPLYKDALQIYTAIYGREDSRVATVQNNMALMYQYMGNLEAAAPLIDSSLEIVKKVYGTENPEYATALENKAALLENEGKRTEAMPLLQEALAIDEKTLGKDHPQYALSLHNLASLHLRQKNYDKAEQLFLQSATLEQKVFGEDHPAYAGTLNNLGVLYEKKDQFEKAEEYFKKALQIRGKILGSTHPEYAYSQYGLALLYLKMGKLDDAKTLYESAISNYLDQVQNFFPALSEKEKNDFYTKIKPVVENFKEFAVEYAVNRDKNYSSDLIGEIYNIQLATKALLLNASNKVRNRIISSGDSELITLFDRWTEIKEKLARYYQYTLEQLQSEEIDLAGLESTSNNLEKQLSLKSELFAGEYDKQSVSWKQIRDKLQPDEAALEIMRVQRNATTDTVMYVALVVRKNLDFPKLIILDYGASLEGDYYKFYKNAINFKMEDPYSYNVFWKKIDRDLQGVKKVYVSADGIFNKININSFRDPSDGTFMLEKYEVSLLSNTRELLKEPTLGFNKTATLLGYIQYQSGQEEKPQPGGVFRSLGSGGWLKNGIPMLRGTKKEVEDISSELEGSGWQTKTLEQNLATEGALKSMRHQGLIHIATHGFFLEDLDLDESGERFDAHVKNYEMNPLFRSGLLLAGSGNTIFGENTREGDDGILTAYEAMNLSLENTDLVVLSACETGLGEVRNGEGVYGLQRALIVAGAKGIIMSLWKVNDEATQKLMTYFYKNWLSGDSKFNAFKKAQLALKEEFKDPYYWAAFVILGR